MINIGLVSPQRGDGCDWYRHTGAWAYLPRDQVRLISSESWDWPLIAECDLLMVGRPYMPAHLGMIKLAKGMGKPVIIDHDDDILHIEISNPAHEVYGTPETLRTVTEIIGMADTIMTSTRALAEVMGIQKSVAVPNAINDFIWQLRPPEKQNKFLLYRGSFTHGADLEGYPEIIARFLERHSEWKLLLMGHPSFQWDCIPKDKRILVAWMSPVNYLNQVIQFAPAVSMTFLRDDEFNRSKSNCAWLEGTLAGAVCMAPGYLDEFAMPGIVNFSDHAGFESCLTDLTSRPEGFRRLLWQKSADYIAQNLMLSKVNEKRVEIIKRYA